MSFAHRPIITASLALMLMLVPAYADERFADGERLVANLIERIQNLVESDPTPDEVRRQTDAIINEFFDYDTIARFAAGQAWRKATPEQKADYKTAFREVLLLLAETQFQQLRDIEYTHVKAIPKGDKLIIVMGRVRDTTGKLPESTLQWRISTRPNKPVRIIDLEIENISMLITQQQENTAIIRQNGGDFQALIDALTEQARQIKESS